MSAFDDYLSAAPAQGSGQTFDAYLGGSQPTAPAAQAAPQAVPPALRAPKAQAQPSAWDQLTRQLGLTARAGVTGVTGLPAMLGDALNSGVNFGIRGVNSLTGTSIPEMQMPSAVIQQGMNAAGVPQPQNGTERVAQDVASAMAGTAASRQLGVGLTQAASPLVARIGSALAAMPGMQMAGAAGSGAGSGIARENGAGALGQTGAGLLGGVAGAVAPSAALGMGRAVAAVPSNIKGAVQPFTNPEAYVGNQFASQLGPDAATIAENIRNGQTFVPGSLPTTAQVGATPRLVATEKSLANASPEFKISMANREAGNNQARWDALMGVAQDDNAMNAAVAAREAAATPLYQQAHQATTNVGPAFMRYAQIPEMQEAMQRAHSAAQLDSAVGRGTAPVWPTPDSRAINGSALDYTSRALGDMIEEAKRSGANSRAASLSALKSNVDNWTERYIPGVQQAKAAYATGSVPVNTMEVGQQIANSLGTRAMGPDGIPMIQLMPYRSALTSAMKGADYGIDPQALTSLQGIGQDLQRATVSNSLRSPGSDTAYNIAANGWLGRQLYGQNFEGAGNAARGVGALGALLTGHPMVAGGILAGGKKLGSMAADRLNSSLGELLLNPEKFLPYLDAVQPGANGAAPALPLGRYINQGLMGSSVTTRPRP